MSGNSTKVFTLQRNDCKLVRVLWLSLLWNPHPHPVISCPFNRSPVGSSRAWEATLASSKTPYMALDSAVPCIHLRTFLWVMFNLYFGAGRLSLLCFCPCSCFVNPNRKAATSTDPLPPRLSCATLILKRATRCLEVNIDGPCKTVNVNIIFLVSVVVDAGRQIYWHPIVIWLGRSLGT